MQRLLQTACQQQKSCMKRIASIFVFIITAAAQTAAQETFHTVNAIVGDASFTQRFGTAPTESTDENLRLQTHLSYVEAMLSGRDVSQLSKAQQENRKQVLELLHEYHTNGVFPKNYDYPGRRPCFIDKDGNICAVGFLIEKTVGRAVAEQINAKHQYQFLLDMNEPVIQEWADTYGLSLEECAAIQPSYGNYQETRTEVGIKPGYGIGSGIFTGANIGLSVMNLRGVRAGNKTLACVGLVTGTSQVIYGIINVKKEVREQSLMGPSKVTSYKAQNNLSYFNVAAGTGTVITSAVNLLLNSKIKDKRNAFNLYSYPDASNKLVAGLAFSRSL